MNVLIVSQHYWPESFRINDVVEDLLRAGCAVTVVTGQPNYPQGQIYPGYRSLGAGRQRHEAGYDIYRVPVFPRGKGGALRLAMNYLSFVISASVLAPWLLRGKSFDIIFVYAVSPILQAIPAIVLRTFKRASLVLWLQDLWPQSLQLTGFVRNKALLRAVGRLTSWIYGRSDLLLVQAPSATGLVRKLSGATPIRYHPNPAETFSAAGAPVEGPTLPDAFNVVFAGNVGTAQAIETIVDAAAILAENRDIHFSIVGSGSRHAWLLEQIDTRGLTNVSAPGRFPPEAMPGLFARASVLLASLGRNDALTGTIPSKVPTYLAAGRPILAAMDGDGADLVVSSGAGLAAPAEDAAALVRTVLAFHSLPEEARAEMGRAGRRAYEEAFEPQRLAAQLIGHFHDAIALRHDVQGPHAKRKRKGR